MGAVPPEVSPRAPARLAAIEWQMNADAGQSPPPGELTTVEGRALLSEAAALGATRALLTGRDPMGRPDLSELVAHGASVGLEVHVLAPVLSGGLAARLSALRGEGLSGVAVALQGPEGKTHDAARGAAGSFASTVELLQAAREEGLAIDVRTALSVGRARGLPAMAELVAAIGARRWTVIAPIGDSGAPFRALALERMLVTLADLAAVHRFEVVMVAAPHLARVVRMRHGASAGGPAGRVHVERDGVERLFVSAAGDIFPSPQLAIPVGRVGTGGAAGRQALTEALDSPLMAELRGAHGVSGKCGVCSFQRLCGGSRARAFAVKADLWAEDPACSYVPRKARGRVGGP